ncbi:MAG TPA: hypothetical protein VEY10_13230, partial [Flavisolibacter sp.]|nr:hypothetical protein [Flavisolibacter sp.]
MDLIKTSFGMQSTAKIVVAGSVGKPMPPLAATPVEPVMGNQKRLLSFFSVAADKRWEDDGITVNSLKTGAIATNLQRHVGGARKTPSELQKTPEQGAA